MNVFDVVSKHVDWLGQRYAVAASNVANLDTPGFRSKTIQPFSLEMEASAHQLTATQQGHLGQFTSVDPNYVMVDQASIDETHSGNNVSLENEMRSIGDTARQMSADTALYKLFHRMILTSMKV